MRRSIILVLFSFALLACLGTRAAAQSGSGCVRVWSCTLHDLNGGGVGCIPFPPKTAWGCYSDLAGTETCFVNSNACSSPDAPKETACASCQSAKAGSPISLATGNTYIEETDVRIPGLGGGLTLERTWNSKWPSSQAGTKIGMFGANWRSTYEERVFVGTDHYMKYALGEGNFWSLGYTDGSTDGTVEKYQVAAPADGGGGGGGGGGGDASLVRDSSTSTPTYTPPWTFTFGDGEQRIFDGATGNLTTIIDRNGNTTTVNYDTQGRIKSVADPAGHVINFSYNDATNPMQATSVDDGCTTCPGGSTIATYQYFHDGTARLQTVTYADGSSVTFQYNDPSSNLLISAVVDGAGKVLEAHSYDRSGRGLSSSQAQGANSVTVSYPQ